MAIPEVFTAAELAEVLAYRRPGYVYAWLSDAVDWAVVLVLLRYGVRRFYAWAERLAERIQARTGRFEHVPVLRAAPKVMDKLWRGPGWGPALLFTAIVFLTINLFYMPVDVFFSYVLEHRHGLSNRSLGGYAWDVVKDITLRLALKIWLVVGLYGLARRLRNWWAWLGAVAGLGLLLSGVLDPFAQRLNFDQHPLPDGPLRQRLLRLIDKAGVEVGDIVVERTSKSTKKVGAYFTGQGPTRQVVLSDTLVEAFPEEEIEVAVAHEAAHLRESRFWGRVGAALLLVGYLFLLDRLFRISARRAWFGATGYADIRTLPLLSVTMLVLFSVASPLAAFFSRERERDADRYALALTGKPETFQSMLVRVARINKLDPAPPAWVVLKGDTHPTIAERLELAEAAKR